MKSLRALELCSTSTCFEPSRSFSEPARSRGANPEANDWRFDHLQKAKHALFVLASCRSVKAQVQIGALKLNFAPFGHPWFQLRGLVAQGVE